MEQVNADAVCLMIQALRDPEFRSAFSTDPGEALPRRGLVPIDLPETVLRQLAELTESELRLLGELADTFADWVRPDGGWPCLL